MLSKSAIGRRSQDAKTLCGSASAVRAVYDTANSLFDNFDRCWVCDGPMDPLRSVQPAKRSLSKSQTSW